MFRLLLTFFISILPIHLSICFAISMLVRMASSTSILSTNMTFSSMLAITLFSGGYLLSIGYYEFGKSKELYFYYNNGLSRFHLYGSAFVINLLLGISIIIFF
jgi:hypothetical protein